MDKRSSRLVAVGIAVFLVGAGLLFVGLRSRSGDSPPEVAVSPTPTPTEDVDGTRVIVQGQDANEVPIIKIPKGHEAVAVQLEFVAGLAGYARPGDSVNLYAAVKGGEQVKALKPPYVKQILRDVEVLDVRGLDGADPTYLLALRTPEVERLVFYSSFEKLWAALATDPEDAGTSRGVDHDTLGG